MRNAIFISLAILTIGCGNDEVSNSTGAGELNAACRESGSTCEIIPLAVGNSWTYEITTYDSLGQLLDCDTSVETIGKDSVIDNETWYSISPIWFTNRVDGLWFNDIGFTEGLLYKYPAQAGDSFKCDLCTDYKIVQSIDTSINLGQGSFYCLKYLSTVPWGDTSYSYVAPGIGFFYQESYYKINDSTLYLGLKKRLILYNL